jgi:hypothetical protein
MGWSGQPKPIAVRFTFSGRLSISNRRIGKHTLPVDFRRHWLPPWRGLGYAAKQAN